MTRAVFRNLNFTLIAAAALSISAPVSASLWHIAADTTAQSVSPDLTRFDEMIRVGDAQIAGDPYCDDREVVSINLVESYGENLQVSRARQGGASVDLWASDRFGTWTAVYTRTDGVACVVGSGTDWTDAMTPEAALGQISI